jgi:hypothetical protein
MKLVRFFILLAVISMFTSNVFSQTCISENSVKTAWSYIPYFNGSSAYLYMDKSSGDYSDYFDSDFSFDMWVKPSWSENSSDPYYLFTAGSFRYSSWNNNHNYLGLEISLVNDSDNWKIRVVNTSGISPQALYYDINDSELFGQWNHLTFTYDASSHALVVYFNGAQKGNHSFAYALDIQHESEGFRMGDARQYWYGSYHNQHFKGYVSGFRLWNSALSSTEISYIWDRTFHQEETFVSDKQYLYDKMIANMYTSSTNVYSLKSGFSIWEPGIARSTAVRHPACPPKIYNLSINDDFCDEIHLAWEVGTVSATNYVYRKEASSGTWALICRTNEHYYHDHNVERGIEYDYKIVSAWKVDTHTAHSNTLRFSPDSETVSGQVRGIAGPSNLTIEEDVNTNSNCNGVVKIKWDPVNTSTYPNFSDYSVECSIEGGAWQTLISGTTQTSYTHNVNSTDFGKSIRYRVMADGDNCPGASDVVSGIANEICTTAPTAVTAIDNNGSIDIQWTYAQVGAPAAHFRVFRSEDGGDYNQIEEDIPVGQTTWTDHDATMCVDYQYKVEAYNHCGASGSLSNSSNIVTLPAVFSDVFTYLDGTEVNADFDASKGYYSNKILLEWSVNPNRQGSIDEYEIFRRKENQPFTLLTTIGNSESTYYEDNSNDPNVLYEYLIRAKSSCGGLEQVSDSLFTNGFRSTSGIVSGKVSFAGGNAVEDVEVIVESEEVNLSNSLHFDGNQYLGGMIPSADVLQNGFTVETWIKPDDMDGGYMHGVVSLNSGMMQLGVKNMKPYATLLAAPMTIEPHVPLMMLEPDSLLNQDEWCHLSLSYNTSTGETNMYLNGEFIAQSIVNPMDQWVPDVPEVDLIVGRVYDSSSYFKGNIDELRLWQRVKSDEEIFQDYKRVLTGSEEGIYGYYRFDEGFGHSAYDVSKSGGEFNKNDLDLVIDPTIFPDWSSEIPSPEQLRPSGITDEHGNYSVRGIVYANGGNIFTVTPYKPLHDFDPMNVDLFIGDNAPVHNNVDFIDQSAFNFSGIVYYSGTNYPLEGADVFIDNQQQFDAGGHPVQTNEYGQFDISVPIGQHFVTVKKDGHVFENNGQWPHPTENIEYPTFNFQSDVSLQTFFDSTKVVLAGRFVGGDVEGNKKLGFNTSVNNIGQGSIVFKNEMGYDINSDPDIASPRVEIQTDSASGEYVIQMIPGVYKIDSVFNADYEMDNLDLGVIDMTEIPELQTVNDTVYTEQIIDEDTVVMQNINHFSYHYKRNFIYYNEPTILLSGGDDEPLIGETEYIYKHQDSEDIDTIDLTNNSPFAYPVFIMGNSYPIQIKVQAIYVNNDTGTPKYDTVPVEGADVTISNNLEINEPFHQFTTDYKGMVSDYNGFRVGLPNMNMNTADQTSFTKTMTITAQAGNFSVAWNDGDVYRGYVLGGVDAGGSNYVTYGPEVPQFILRDPPGDRSYTTLEQGSSFSASRDYSFNMGGTSDYDNVLMCGVKFEAGGGLAGPVFTSEVQSDLNAGISTTSWVDDSGAFMETYEFNQTYSTSADPNGVGSMADVYIGKSVNLFFTETENLKIYPKDYCYNSGLDYLENEELADSTAEFSIGKRSGFAVTDDPSSTFFIYSQDHILNSLLPTYRDLIYNLLSSANYESYLPAEHLFYGFDNENPVFESDTISTTSTIDSLPSYQYHGEGVDSIAALNQQISLWIQTIAFNEAAKLADDMDMVENISFDGNAGAYMNETSMTTSSFTTKEYFYRFELFGGSTSGFSINKTGLMTYSQTYKNIDQTISATDSEENRLKWKYVIDDSNQGDYYSIDVMTYNQGTLAEGKESFLNSNNFEDAGYHMGNLGLGTGIGAGVSFITSLALSKLVNPLAGQAFSMAYTIGTAAGYMYVMNHYADETESNDVYFGLQGASPMFRIMGGQSRCPYEGPETSIFYIDSVTHEPFSLHVGTQNHEAPKLEIEPATVINVPDGSPAVFELKLMNESPTGADLTYELQVDEASNPHGANLRVDGLSPNRPFFVPAGQTLTKTLTVERGASSQMEFDDLQLILHSTCQFNPDDNYPDIADTVSFSAHFIPVCTQVDFGNVENNWIVNTYYNDEMPITINGYNINQENFEKVYFQYQQSGATPSTAMVLYNDTINTDWATYTGNKIYIDGQSQVNFDWDVSSLNDGEYTIFLTSACSDGSTYETDHYNGIIDRVTPRPFGTPQPSDGILSYGEDILIKFNETINSGELYNFGQYGSASYISLRGMKNGTDLLENPYLLHDASVHFDGVDDFMKIDHLNLDHTDFTFEFWVKRDQTGTEPLICMGDVNNGGLWIGFDANNYLTMIMDGQTIISANTCLPEDDFAFVAIAYNSGDEMTESRITMQLQSGAAGGPEDTEFDMYSSLEGSMYLGYNPNDGSAFNGNIHEFRIWNYARSGMTSGSEKSLALTGYESGLYSLWPMTDAHGTIAHDIAFGRNAELNATWQVSRNGKSVNFIGDNALNIPTASMVFNDETDFTVEFWFKTGMPLDTIALMSTGYPAMSPNQNAWNVFATADGKLGIQNKNQNISIDAENVLDNNWHHFAMSLNRIGYLSVYFDGELVKTHPVAHFGGFGTTNLVFGARWYYFEMNDYFDQYLTGYIDEIRVWNAAKRQTQIQRYMNHTLVGDEMGLKAYFPFEDVTIEDPSISNESPENFTQDTLGIADNPTIEIQDFSSESPHMKLQKPEILLHHNLVINDDEVIIAPNEDANEIENQIVDISIKNVKDMFGNVMTSTVTWTAFIDQNQVVWDVQELNLEKFVDEELILTVNIRNQSGVNEAWDITNIPSWMQVQPASGVLSPLETEEIEIRIMPELNIGSYQHDLNLTASMEYHERLTINLKVKGHAPNWSVNAEDFSQTASIIGQLSIGDILSTDTDDIVAIFANGECRGLAQPEYLANMDAYLLFMNVFANESGEQMSFKVYDASTGNVYSHVTPNLTFAENAVYGAINDPLAINATNYIEQNISVQEGWNWVSFNVYADHFQNLNTAFENLLYETGDFMKAQSVFAQVQSNQEWFGSLDSLNLFSSYKMQLSNSQEFIMEGYRVIPDTIQIPIVEGWNWIGYPKTTQTPLMDALSSLQPENNDIIKSQHAFAVYSDLQGWIGSLNYLTPGQGYVLYATNGGTLQYSQSMNFKQAFETNPMQMNLPNTETNMCMIVDAELDHPEMYQIQAYDKNGLCGYANPIKMPDESVRFFLTVNSLAPETISFAAHGMFEQFTANENLNFNSDATIGSLENPFVLSFNETIIPDTQIDVFPNPFEKELMLSLYLHQDEAVEIELYNALGQLVSKSEIELSEGQHKIDLFKSNFVSQKLAEGVYTLKISVNGTENQFKIVKQ